MTRLKPDSPFLTDEMVDELVRKGTRYAHRDPRSDLFLRVRSPGHADWSLQHTDERGVKRWVDIGFIRTGDNVQPRRGYDLTLSDVRERMKIGVEGLLLKNEIKGLANKFGYSLHALAVQLIEIAADSYISPNWSIEQLNMVAMARRVIGYGGALPPYEGLIKKFLKAKNFKQAFELYDKKGIASKPKFTKRKSEGDGFELREFAWDLINMGKDSQTTRCGFGLSRAQVIIA